MQAENKGFVENWRQIFFSSEIECVPFPGMRRATFKIKIGKFPKLSLFFSFGLHLLENFSKDLLVVVNGGDHLHAKQIVIQQIIDGRAKLDCFCTLQKA